MHIEEIAKLAGVSITTVSKIVNGKDQSISEKTRKKVLDIVKKYNYTPYGSVLRNKQNRQFQIAYLDNASNGGDAFVNGLLMGAQSRNYNVLLCNSFGDKDEELKNISRIIRDRVDAVIWKPLNESSRLLKDHFDRVNIPVYFMSTQTSFATTDLDIDRQEMAYAATELLINQGHEKIACISTDTNSVNNNVFAGFKRCMFDNHLSLAQEHIIHEISPDLLTNENTAYLCIDINSASSLYGLAKQYNVSIPMDLSIIALQDHDGRSSLSPISSMIIPWAKYGEHVAHKLVDDLEQVTSKHVFDDKPYLSNRNSLAEPKTTRLGRLLVVGSLNMDITINTRVPLKTGVTTIADGWNHSPGGKGLNQSIAAAKMGGRVSIIGKIGKDYDGSLLHKVLSDNHVDSSGLSSTDSASTGKAYVAVQEDGESSIAIYAGANGCLTPEDIDDHISLFQDSAYCLIPLEIPQQTVIHAAYLAKKHDVKLVVKPTNSLDLTDEFLSLVDILVPNRKEAQLLCGNNFTIEEQAEDLLDRGVNIVIVTMGSEGCYLCTRELKKHYKALNVTPIDTTGGADAFIGALVTFLTEGETLELAVERANYAAGLSVMNLGVESALVHRETFELYYERGLYV